MNLREAKALLIEMDKSVRSDDPRMRRKVLVTHEDGTTFFFRYAYAVRCHNYLFVFSEHQGPHCFYINDLSCYEQYEAIEDELEVVDDSGKTVTSFTCSYCGTVIKEYYSLYDEMGNRLDVEVCEKCSDAYHEKNLCL